MNWLDAVETLESGSIVAPLNTERWMMHDPLGIYLVNGGDPHISLSEYSGEWECYHPDKITSDELAGMQGKAIAAETSLYAYLRRGNMPAWQIAAIIAQQTMQERGKYYAGYRVVQRDKKTRCWLPHWSIKTNSELATFVAHKYATDNSTKYFMLFQWLLRRNDYTMDIDGKPDCIRQLDPEVDLIRPEDMYDIDGQTYVWEKLVSAIPGYEDK